MSKFVFLVTVETERESGLIASRDEQSEKILDELERIGDYVSISGIGARSDSEYTVSSSDVWEMSMKDEKELNEAFERQVAEARPPKDELAVELKLASDERDKYRKLYEGQKAIVDKLLESPEFKQTRIWTEDRSGGEKVYRYLPDGRYDKVHFKIDGGDDDAAVTIGIDDYTGDLEIRANAMGREMMVIPQSGNEVRLRVDRRVR
jgi:hypothetical protein